MSSENNLKEYVVTLHRFDDLESFYTDMETEGGDLYIPNRVVDVANRRPISRNTHYMLSDQEAAQLRQDPRVLAVELTLEQLGIKEQPAWTQTSSFWSKSATVASGHLNWGILRVAEGQQRPNWGIGAGGTTEVTGTVTIPFSGKNIDVVIVDDTVDRDHPEFAKNIDGTGGTRFVSFNWLSLNPVVNGSAAGTYSYALKADDFHGTLCAGIVAGNTYGWARDANIYNFDLFANGGSSVAFDYVRAWHNAKAINPATGRKNPTVINASFVLRTISTGSFDDPFINQITSVVYRGTTYPRPSSGSFTAAELRAFGIRVRGTAPFEKATLPARNTAVEADIADCIAAGIIIVASAGNDSTKIDVVGGIDYDNQVSLDVYGNNLYAYNRGPAPAAADNVICVGAIGAGFNGSLEEKATYSNCGPGVDIFAPGSNITSAVPSNYTGVFVLDTRNSKISKNSGTSFSGPQIAGMVATLLEVTPTSTSADALSYITGNAKTGQIYNSSNLDFYDLQGAPNRYAFAKYPTTISITPSTTTVTPLQSVDYTISIPDVTDGSFVYLTESGTSVSTDFDDGVTQFVLVVYSGTASLTRTVRSGVTGSRTSRLQLRTGGYDGNIQATASAVTVSVSDFASSSGSFTVNAQGGATFSITPSLDSVIEGAETFTVSIRTGSISGNAVVTSSPITINDA